MNKFDFRYTLIVAGLIVASSYSAQANDCPDCKKIEKGVSTTVEKTGQAIKNVGEDIGKGLDKMFGWMFKPQK
ncbi:MAG: hypothetical protein ACKOW3_01525 [Hyphomicrobium sp.]